ncbi:MAG: response regulator, partial [Candidatus Aureabacteria bacterium]|nr:response regulator [Candidatus Auribacterota bacterium]
MGRTVLIADDQAFMRHILGTDLSSHGYTIHYAENGRDAVSKAKEIMPDIILLDIMMPVMDGYEACAQIRKEPLIKDIPVIFLTANAQKSAIIKAVQAGGNDYAVKSPDSS